MGGHLDALGAEQINSLSGDQGVGVVRTDDHPTDATVQNGLCAGRRFAVVAAGLQSDVKGGALGRCGTVCQSIALCVKTTVLLVIALSDDDSVFDNHGAYHRVGTDPAGSFLGQL